MQNTDRAIEMFNHYGLSLSKIIIIIMKYIKDTSWVIVLFQLLWSIYFTKLVTLRWYTKQHGMLVINLYLAFSPFKIQ